MRGASRQVLAGLFCLLLAGCRGQANHKGNKAPDFTLPLLSSAETFNLNKAVQESPVLIAFWASWCPSCVEEIPELNARVETYKQQGIRIVSVNVQESAQTVLDFQKTHNMNYPVALDEEGKVAALYDLVGLPAAVLVAKGGEILYYDFSLPENVGRMIEQRRSE